MAMQHSHDQKHNIINDCCYQQWPTHHHLHHHQQLTPVPSPMQQMEGKKYIFLIYSNEYILIIII